MERPFRKQSIMLPHSEFLLPHPVSSRAGIRLVPREMSLAVTWVSPEGSCMVPQTTQTRGATAAGMLFHMVCPIDAHLSGNTSPVSEYLVSEQFGLLSQM